MNPEVDFFFEKEGKWKKAYEKLREIALSFGLKEELKWGKPCYTLNGKNVFLIHGFKGYSALLFHKGAILKDPKSILIQQTENVQAARQLRFESADEIVELETEIRAIITDAIKVEKSGKEVKLKKTAAFDIPSEFKEVLADHSELKSAFEGLTPGRQRAYLLYFSGAKQSKTRTSRIEKHIQHILDGKGMQD